MRLFGTDGVRSLANKAPMDSDTVLKLGQALAHYIGRDGKKNKKILIGKDTRLSGYMLENALVSGICSMGVTAQLIGPIPTPGVAFMTRGMRADAGIMISASHNPFEDNGIKIFGPDGFKLPDHVEDEMEALMFSKALNSFRAGPAEIGKAFRIDDATGRYVAYLKGCFYRTFKLDGIKIVLDTANGAAYKVAPMVFRELGAEVVLVGGEPNGTNINDGVGSLFPENIAKLVVEEKANIGISLDGDADRVILVDETGKIVDGDHLLAVLALHFKEHGQLVNNGVVGTVMSNLGLEMFLKEHDIKFIRTAVGDRYVLEKMIADGYNMGGEQSGHFIVLDYNTTGDGVLTALMFLSIMIKAGKSVSQLTGMMKMLPQMLINIKVSKKPPLETLDKVQAEIKAAETLLAHNGRLLVRYSGTENKARVMVEAQDEGLCKSIAQKLAEVIREELA